MIDFPVHEKTMKRIRAVRDEYVSMFPSSPLSTMTEDRDILLFILFYGESMLNIRIEKKKAFGIAACMGGPE